MMPSQGNVTDHDPFADVLGQARAKKIVWGALQRDTLASSYLFFGPPGTGKLAMALALARAINCRGQAPRPCGQCSACRRTALLQHPDVTVLFPHPTNISDEDLRAALDKLAADPYADLPFSERSDIHIKTIQEVRRQAVLRPYEGRKKVFILAQADRLTRDAANALLKTLEEPPGHVLLVLTSARPGGLPATVLSRCQQVRFAPLSPQDLLQGLERLSLGDAKTRPLAARLAQGNLRQAVKLVAEGIRQGGQDVLPLLSRALEQDFKTILHYGKTLGRAKNRAESRRHLEALQIWYRDLMLLAEGHETDLVNTHLVSQLADMRAQYDWIGIQLCLEDIRESFRAMDANVNLELIWIALFARLKRRRKKGANR
jgi:DNA polymerase-3 subunit delta'